MSLIWFCIGCWGDMWWVVACHGVLDVPGLGLELVLIEELIWDGHWVWHSWSRGFWTIETIYIFLNAVTTIQ